MLIEAEITKPPCQNYVINSDNHKIICGEAETQYGKLYCSEGCRGRAKLKEAYSNFLDAVEKDSWHA